MPEPEEPEQRRKIFVGSLVFKTDEKDLKEFYSQFGEITDCVVMKASNVFSDLTDASDRLRTSDRLPCASVGRLENGGNNHLENLIYLRTSKQTNRGGSVS